MEKAKKHRFLSRLLTMLIFLLTTVACGKVYSSFISFGVVLALCVLLVVVSIAIWASVIYLLDRIFADRQETEFELTFPNKDDTTKK